MAKCKAPLNSQWPLELVQHTRKYNKTQTIHNHMKMCHVKGNTHS